MKWIITGGAGFIGCHAAARFLTLGHQVIVVDNLSRRTSKANLKWLQGQGLTEFVEADVRQSPAINQLFTRHQDVSAVIHLAAQVAVTESCRDPRTDFETNALGTFNVLEAVRTVANGRPAVLYSSTNKVYGSLEHLKIGESADRYSLSDRPQGIDESEPLDFHSPYGCSKGTGDQYVFDYARIYGLKTVVFRQSCIYGTRQIGVEDQGWIAWFAIAAMLGKAITVYGNGKQVRDALWVDDLVDLYASAFENIDHVQGQVFNVGGGPENTMSLRELLTWLEAEFKRPLEIRFDAIRPGDQNVFVAGLAKARQMLGWRPKVSTQEGLRKLVDWLRANREQFV